MLPLSTRKSTATSASSPLHISFLCSKSGQLTPFAGSTGWSRIGLWDTSQRMRTTAWGSLAPVCSMTSAVPHLTMPSERSHLKGMRCASGNLSTYCISSDLWQAQMRYLQNYRHNITSLLMQVQALQYDIQELYVLDNIEEIEAASIQGLAERLNKVAELLKEPI